MRRPSCPRHQHGKVWFDGSYGPPGRERQRYKCVPANGEPRHVFTEPLPRQRAFWHDCVECERPLERGVGPPAVRGYTYTAREIADALAAVGRGESYSAAAAQARIAAGRHPEAKHPQARPPASRDSAIVEDWVEVFGPLIIEPRRERSWPSVIVIDDLPFRVRSVFSRGGSIVAWRVFGARGVDGTIVRLEAFPDKRPASWQQFFAGLEGMPDLIVCDAESGMRRGIELAFGSTPYASPVVWLCHYHLRLALRKLLRRYNAHPVLSSALERAFNSERDWRRFVRFEQRYPCPRLARWLRAPDPTWWAGRGSRHERIVWQLQHQVPELPASVGAIEATFAWLRDRLKQRAFCLRNRERTNRMLALIELHLNGKADARRYALTIRREIEKRGGYGGPRQAINDRRGYSSLWR